MWTPGRTNLDLDLNEHLLIYYLFDFTCPSTQLLSAKQSLRHVIPLSFFRSPKPMVEIYGILLPQIFLTPRKLDRFSKRTGSNVQFTFPCFRQHSPKVIGINQINSAIHKVAGLMVPGHSMISTGTIPVEQKSVHWLSMGATGRNGLCWVLLPAVFWEQPVTKEPAAL